MHDQFDVTLEDQDLLREVELTTNLIIAASETDEHLSLDEIDQILGVVPAGRPGLTLLPTPPFIPSGVPFGSMAHEHGYISRKDDYLTRLRRIEGQARGLQRMVDEEKYCIDILTQVSAMTKALQAVAIGLLEDHMNHCVVDAARPATPRPARRSPRPPRRSPAWSGPDDGAAAMSTTTGSPSPA